MEITRVFDLLDNFKEKYSDKDDVIAGKENGRWVKYSTLDYIEQSNLVSCGLLALGLKKGDRIASISNNRPEWNFLDMGMAQAGIIHVPIYPTISKDDYFYILTNCKPKIVIISDKILYDKIQPIAAMAGINDIYTINNIDGVKNWQAIISKGKDNLDKLMPELMSIKESIKTEDLFTLIYTSGTTGFPKGVMLSHSNLVNNFIETSKHHNSGSEARALSFLPLSHVYERCLNYHYQYKGIGIYYAENMGTIVDDTREIKPTLFCSVPRVLELFFEKIQGKGHELPFLSRIIFFWAIRVAEKFDIDKPDRWFYNLKLKIADKLVFSKWREALGGKLDKIVSGGASLQIRLTRIFWAAGMHIIEGYGLTETSPVIAVNDLAKPMVKFGTVGPILKGVEVKIADDGEILCKGHNVMIGYYNDPKLTKASINKEGWFHTGDIGTLVDGKFLMITDRKKEIFKLSSGRYVAPQVIENKLKESEFIEQAMVLGENQKFASALIQPNFSFLQTWCICNKIHFNDNIEIINNPKVIRQFNKVIVDLNQKIGHSEHIKRFRLVPDEWSTFSGELSPTLKLKRNYIYEKYKDIIDQIYVLQKNGKDLK
jgi:long-chain acyl-CoA synthetase